MLKAINRFGVMALCLSVWACQDIEPTKVSEARSQALSSRDEAIPPAESSDASVKLNPRPESPADTVPNLLLMTFNIRYGTAADGANAWTNRRSQLFALMRAQAADAVGMQEALAFQIDEILLGVPGYARIGVGRDDGKAAGEFSPILYRTARFRVDTSGTFWFSDTPTVPGSKSWGNGITRICSWAHLVDKASGRGHYIFNVHLDHESQPSREKSVQLLIQRIAAVKQPAEPVFVTGDFNVGESDPVIRYMKGKLALEGKPNPIPFLDSFRELHPTDTQVATWHDFKGDLVGDKIDYVFILPRIKTLKADIIRSNEAGKYPSDHYPVTAAVTVPDWAVTSIRQLY